MQFGRQKFESNSLLRNAAEGEERHESTKSSCPWFYPDPSICSANGKYYLACSSFEYFPGVPLFESDDLLNWKPIGHCLTRKSQVNLYQVPGSGGVFAPTIRFHNGRFYMVTNNNTYQKILCLYRRYLQRMVGSRFCGSGRY